MSPSDRFILLVSLSIFFFAGALALVSINLRNNDSPRSVMVSPTAADMTARDPKPRVSEVIKLCYSEQKYNEIIKTGRNGQALVGQGTVEGGIPLEIYASNILGYGGAFSIYMWEQMPDGSKEICRILAGKNLEVMSRPSGTYLEKLDENLVISPEESGGPIAPTTLEDSSPVLRHGTPELQVIPGQPKLGNNPADK